ncbi:two-component system, sensor histidine kinase YesM [Enterococcus sp. AZ194]|uniref:sensor histidine kinase n=1 Tax=Enterococcus sp. AZ194 TaxID=2774629 RepID=UPI003F210B81
MHSIKRQIIFLFLFVSISLIGALSFTLHRELKKSVIPLNTSITQQFVNSKTQEINSWFGNRIAEIAMIADATSGEAQTREQLFTSIHALEAREKENYVSIRLVSTEGISFSEEYPQFSIETRNYYKKLLANPNHKYTVSNLVTSKEDDQSIVIILYRLTKVLPDGTAYIAAAVPLEKVMNLAEDLSIYDGRGSLLSSGDQGIAIDDEKQLLFTSNLSLLPDWKVHYVIEKENLSESTAKLQYIVLFISILVLVVLGVLLFFLMRGIIRPILSLKETMRNVQEGNRVVRADVATENEIGELAESFNQTLDKVYENEENYRNASMRLLQEQIQPHFLYNTLDMIQWQILGGASKEAVKTVEYLALFFRRGLNQGNELTTVQQELEHVRSYLQIQKLRHETLQEVQIDCPTELQGFTMLHFILQPLVENAIQHGIRSASQKDLCLFISVSHNTENYLVFTVENNGQLPTKEVLAQLNSNTSVKPEKGFGVFNVRHRLKLFYGGTAHLSYRIENERLCAEIAVPIRELG